MKTIKLRPAQLAALLMVGTLTFLPMAAYAAEASEETETATEAEDVLVQSGTDESSLNSLQESMTAEANNVQYLNNLIQELAGMESGEVTSDIIRKLHDAYEALSDAGKANVRDYDIVAEYIESMRLDFSSSETEEELKADSGRKLSTTYVLDIENSISVTISYVVDTNDDGTADSTDITLTSPSGAVTTLSDGTTTIEDGSKKVYLTWEPAFVQLDILSAEKGKWILRTSDDVVFNSFEYAGKTDTGFETAASVTDSVDGTDAASYDEVAENDADPGSKGKTKLLVFALVFAIFVFLVFFVLKKFILKTPESGKKSGKGSRKRSRKPQADDGDDEYDWSEISREKKEAEMREMEKFVKNLDIEPEEDIDEADDESADPRDDKAMENSEGESGNCDGESEEFTEFPSGVDDEDEEDVTDNRFGNRF